MAHARKHEIQLLLRLEAKLEWHNERTRHPGEYKTFREGMCDLSTIHDMCLAYSFQSIDTLGLPLANLHNLAEAALANNGSQFEIIDGEWMTLKKQVITRMTRRKGLRTLLGRKETPTRILPLPPLRSYH